MPINPRGRMATRIRRTRGDVGGNYSYNPPMQDQPGMIAPRQVRASGSGPYDPAYRQNLAVFGSQGAQMQPGGITFNPTSPGSEGRQPIGGGNAPTYGMFPGALDYALNQPNVLNSMSPVGSPYYVPGGVFGNAV